MPTVQDVHGSTSSPRTSLFRGYKKMLHALGREADCCNCINRPSVLSLRHANKDSTAHCMPERTRALAFGLHDRGGGHWYSVGDSIGRRGPQWRHGSPRPCLWHAFMHGWNIPAHKKSTARPYERRFACRPVRRLHGAYTVFHPVPNLPAWRYCCQLPGCSCRHGAGRTAALTVGSTSATTRIETVPEDNKKPPAF